MSIETFVLSVSMDLRCWDQWIFLLVSELMNDLDILSETTLLIGVSRALSDFLACLNGYIVLFHFVDFSAKSRKPLNELLSG